MAKLSFVEMNFQLQAEVNLYLKLFTKGRHIRVLLRRTEIESCVIIVKVKISIREIFDNISATELDMLALR